MGRNTKVSEDRYLALLLEASYHCYLYYVLDKPEIQDSLYDALIKHLERIEATNKRMCKPHLHHSPTQHEGWNDAFLYKPTSGSGGDG